MPRIRILATLGLLAAAAVAQAQPQWTPPPADGNEPWRHAVPEPGVVVSGDGTAYAPAYPQEPPVVYAPPVYAPPVYVQPAYAWPQPYIYPPVGISLGIGYSRGWHGGGHRHGRWR